MKPTSLLRVAAVLTLIHAALHTVGGVFGKPTSGAAAAAFTAMQSNQFPVMGFTRTYADFYRGLGLAVSIFLTAEAIVFWQLGSMAKTQAHRLRPVLATFLVAYLALAVNSYLYFFLPPVVTEVLIALCLALAILKAKPVPATQNRGATFDSHPTVTAPPASILGREISPHTLPFLRREIGRPVICGQRDRSDPPANERNLTEIAYGLDFPVTLEGNCVHFEEAACRIQL